MKLTEFIVGLWRRIKRGLVRFVPFHVGAIAIAVILMSSVHHVLGDDFAFNYARGICWGMLSGVLVKLLGEKYGWRGFTADASSWCATIVIAALGCWFWTSVGDERPRYWLWVMLYSGTCIALAASCISVLYSRANERTLFSDLFFRLLGVYGSAFIFSLSMMLCFAAYNLLIAKLNDKLIADLAILCNIALGPIVYASLLPRRDGDGGMGFDKAGRFLFWIILPSALVLLGILYIYLGKILFTGNMPSGQLNWFGSIALSGYLFFWLTLRKYENGFFRMFSRWGWTLLVPVLVAQIVGIVIRYNAYGLSAPRLAGMVTLAIGIYALVLAALNRGPASLFPLIAALGLFFTISPWNIVDLPIRNQEMRLRSALERNGCLKNGHLVLPEKPEIGETDSDIIIGSWKYLVSNRYSYRHIRSVKYSREYDFGRVKPMVWGEAAFTIGLCEETKKLCEEKNQPKCSLPDLLGVKPSEKVRRSDRHSNWCSLKFQYPQDRFFKLDSSVSVRYANANYTQTLTYTDGKWMLGNDGCDGKSRDYDVTAEIKRIFGKAGIEAVQMNKTFDLDDETALWHLDDDYSLLVDSVMFNGYAGEPITCGWINNSILIKRGK